MSIATYDVRRDQVSPEKFKPELVTGTSFGIKRALDVNMFTIALLLRQDFDGGQQPIFIGHARPGTAESAAKWRIRKRTYSSGKLVEENFAGGTDQFDQVWNDRSGLSYS